jgi:predicted permease
MDQWLGMLSAVVAIFTVMGLGWVARRVGWLTEEADGSLLKVVVNLLVPALILKAVLGNAQLHRPANILLPPVIGFGSVILGFAVAAAVAKGLRLGNEAQRRTFALCVGVYNYVYIPLPLAEQLFGPGTVGVLFVYNLGVEIAMWTAGVMLISGHVEGQWYKRVLNVPSLTIVVALGLNLLGVDRYVPGFLQKGLGMLGQSAIPLALLLIGATIADYGGDIKIRRGLGTIGASCLLRLGVLPVMFLAVAYFVPMSVDLKRVIVLQAAMPAATFPIVLARHYGGDPPTALRVVLGTGLVSLLTMPAWVTWGMWVLGLRVR